MSTSDGPLHLALPRLVNQGIWGSLYLTNILTIAVAGAIALIPMTRSDAGLVWLAASSPLWAPIAVMGFITVRGTPGPIIVWREAVFRWRKLRGQTSYRHRPDAEASRALARDGYLTLPGRLQNVRLLSGMDGAAVLHDTAKRTVTVIAEVAAEGFLAASARRQDDKVQGLAAIHRSWTLRKGIKRFTQTERTLTGSSYAAERVARRAATTWPGAAPEVHESLWQSFKIAEPELREHRTQMAWTFDLGELQEQIRAAGGGEAGLGRVLEGEMTALRHAVLEAGFANLRWLTPGEVRGLARMQLDPAMTTLLQAREAEGRGEVAPGGEAVMALDEERSYVLTDSGVHRTVWIVQWPQFLVRPGVLDRVISGSTPEGDPIRHTLAIVEAPVPIGKAMSRIRDQKKAWEARDRTRQKRGQITSEAEKHEWQLLIEQEQRLVAGQGEFEVAAYLTLSATSLEELDRASSAMHTHLSNAGLEAHTLYSQQAEALMMTAIPNGEGLG